MIFLINYYNFNNSLVILIKDFFNYLFYIKKIFQINLIYFILT